MNVLGIPMCHEWNGITYNNARMMRSLIPQIGGEYVFRDLVDQQWRENGTDNMPRSVPAAFFAKLYARRDRLRKDAQERAEALRKRGEA